jgi:hypothetical protein
MDVLKYLQETEFHVGSHGARTSGKVIMVSCVEAVSLNIRRGVSSEKNGGITDK